MSNELPFFDVIEGATQILGYGRLQAEGSLKFVKWDVTRTPSLGPKIKVRVIAHDPAHEPKTRKWGGLFPEDADVLELQEIALEGARAVSRGEEPSAVQFVPPNKPYLPAA